jgi:hypothetical protein
MESLLVYLPAVVILLALTEINPGYILIGFLVSLWISVNVAYASKDERFDEVGPGLSLFCVAGAAYYLFQSRHDLNVDAAFVLFASLMNLVGMAKRMPKK